MGVAPQRLAGRRRRQELGVGQTEAPDASCRWLGSPPNFYILVPGFCRGLSALRFSLLATRYSILAACPAGPVMEAFVIE